MKGDIFPTNLFSFSFLSRVLLSSLFWFTGFDVGKKKTFVSFGVCARLFNKLKFETSHL